MSEKSIKNVAITDNNFAPIWITTYPLPFINFNGNCLINKLPDSAK